MWVGDHHCVPSGYWCRRCGRWVPTRCFHPAPAIPAPCPTPVIPYFGNTSVGTAIDVAKDVIAR